jgi:polyisoprenoid-binding protein YceI
MDTITRSQNSLLPTGVWRLDPRRSRVGFSARKLGSGTVRGSFDAFDGTVAIDAEGATASGAVDVASVSTANADRDAHLRRFFDADRFPQIVLRASWGEPVGAQDRRIAGELTIRDRTHPIELRASRHGARGLRVRGELDRRDFGLTWNRAVEATGVVAPVIGLELELEWVSA